MHEWSIAQSVANLVREKVGGDFTGRVVAVNVKIGKLRGVPSHVLRSCFEALTTGTPVEEARLEITEVEPKARCRSCGRTVLPADLLPDGPHYSVHRPCPSCGSDDIEIAAGNELFVESIEVED